MTPPFCKRNLARSGTVSGPLSRFVFFSSRRRHTRCSRDWSSDVCSSDLHYSPFKAGAGYVPITAGFAVAGAISSQLISRVGAGAVIVVGALIGAAGVYLL